MLHARPAAIVTTIRHADSRRGDAGSGGFAGFPHSDGVSGRVEQRLDGLATARSVAQGLREMGTEAGQPGLLALVTNDLCQLLLSRAHGKKRANEKVNRD